jgi:translation initiation factor IF-3
VNHKIRVPFVRLIDPEGKQLGVVAIKEALSYAEEENLDLVEVAPQADPPVCKVMDYGKYKYIMAKKQQEAKKRQTIIQVKEVKMRPKTDEHDFQVKLRRARQFLEKKNKVKVTVMFRGREMAHPELGRVKLERMIEETEDIAQVEGEPRFEGRTVFVMLAAK